MRVLMGIISSILAIILVGVAWLFWHFHSFFITVIIVAVLIYAGFTKMDIEDAPK